MGADNPRILAKLQVAGARRSATAEQINAHLRNPGGSLRTGREVAKALHDADLRAATNRINTQLRATDVAWLLPGASDEQIKAHLRNSDRSWRTKKEVAKALNDVGLGADINRIRTQMQAARVHQQSVQGAPEST